MPIGKRPFKEIEIDFIGKLLESEAFNAILVIKDHFTKVQYYIATKTIWTAADVADSYINDIWKICGLPRQISSDCGPRFPSRFLNELN